MLEIRSCKRCSVKRVNALCELFDMANHNNDNSARRALNELINIADKRGYKRGQKVWEVGLSKSEVRSICWNISSLLKDEDLEQLGVEIR